MTTPPGNDPYGQQPDESEQQSQYDPPGYGPPPQAPPPGYGPPPQYGQTGYGPPPQYGPPGYYAPPPERHPSAMTSLVLGIVGLVICQVASPFAWWFGKKTMNEIEAQPGRYGGYGEAKAGWICGIIGTALLAFAVLIFVGLFVIGIIAATVDTTSSVGTPT